MIYWFFNETVHAGYVSSAVSLSSNRISIYFLIDKSIFWFLYNGSYFFPGSSLFQKKVEHLERLSIQE